MPKACTEFIRGKVTIKRKGGGPNSQAYFGDGLPDAFALTPNFPNPFRVSTTIGIDLPEAAYVRLSVYDALGRLILAIDESMEAGSHTRMLDAAGLAAAPTSSGSRQMAASSRRGG